MGFQIAAGLVALALIERVVDHDPVFVDRRLAPTIITVGHVLAQIVDRVDVDDGSGHASIQSARLSRRVSIPCSSTFVDIDP